MSPLVPAFLSVKDSTVHGRISPAFSGLLTWVLWPKNVFPVPRQALVSFVRGAYCSPNSSENLFGSWEGIIKSVENGHFLKTPNPMPQLAQLSLGLPAPGDLRTEALRHLDSSLASWIRCVQFDQSGWCVRLHCPVLSKTHASVLEQGASPNPSHLLALKEEKGRAAAARQVCPGNLRPASSVTSLPVP